MIQDNNTIDKHFMKPLPHCSQAMCWSSILKPPQMIEDAIELIEMFLQLRESKIVYHLYIIIAVMSPNMSYELPRYEFHFHINLPTQSRFFANHFFHK